jgi:hypothetical protein
MLWYCNYDNGYTFGATDATAANLPTGLTVVDTAAKTVTISGTPTASVPIQ